MNKIKKDISPKNIDEIKNHLVGKPSFKLNYADWFSVLANEDTYLKEFTNRVQEYCLQNQKEIYLEKGDYIILNNSTFLHSRTKLNKHSRRCHRRYLI